MKLYLQRNKWMLVITTAFGFLLAMSFHANHHPSDLILGTPLGFAMMAIGVPLGAVLYRGLFDNLDKIFRRFNNK